MELAERTEYLCIFEVVHVVVVLAYVVARLSVCAAKCSLSAEPDVLVNI